MSNVPVISARGVRKKYGPTVALAGVDLDIAAGQSVAIMGASGSGKTTLLHSLAGIISPDEGEVWFQDGHGRAALHQLNAEGRARLRRERIGLVFQQGLLLHELTAQENVALPLLLNGAERSEAMEQARVWLSHLGLDGLGERRIGQLSGGQAQRVAVARAHMSHPAVVFADEPTGALDSRTSAEVMDLLVNTTRQRGGSLVVVTHDPQVAQRCARTIRVVDGAIAADSLPGHESPKLGEGA